MRLTIVIPAYNEKRYLRGCLERVFEELARTPHGRTVEVIVVDNASTDDTAEVARPVPGVRVVREPRKGLTRARQCGLEEAHGEIVGYVDADTRMDAGWIVRALTAFEDPAVVAVSGPCTYYDASRFEAILVWAYWSLLAMPVYWLAGYMLLGGNFAARKSALEKIGGFDSSILFYGEDTDIARRLHAVGKVKFTRRMRVTASARRLHAEGVFATALRYAANFLSEAILGRPVTNRYLDIR